jgi:hypothetical protein
VSLDITREDGRTFSLTSVDVQSVLVRVVGVLTFTPFAASGNLDYLRSIEEIYLPIVSDLNFTGISSDGTRRDLYSSSLDEAAFFGFYTSRSDTPELRGDGRYDFAGTEALALSDLTSLSIRGNTWNLTDDLFRRSMEISETSNLFRVGFEQCAITGQGINAQGYWSCSLAGFGEFSSFATPYGNWSTNVQIDNLRFTLGQPAPVPLPAGLPLMVAGLAALGLLARRRARSA